MRESKAQDRKSPRESELILSLINSNNIPNGVNESNFKMTETERQLCSGPTTLMNISESSADPHLGTLIVLT